MNKRLLSVFSPSISMENLDPNAPFSTVQDTEDVSAIEYEKNSLKEEVDEAMRIEDEAMALSEASDKEPLEQVVALESFLRRNLGMTLNEYLDGKVETSLESIDSNRDLYKETIEEVSRVSLEAVHESKAGFWERLKNAFKFEDNVIKSYESKGKDLLKKLNKSELELDNDPEYSLKAQVLKMELCQITIENSSRLWKPTGEVKGSSLIGFPSLLPNLEADIIGSDSSLKDLAPMSISSFKKDVVRILCFDKTSKDFYKDIVKVDITERSPYTPKDVKEVLSDIEALQVTYNKYLYSMLGRLMNTRTFDKIMDTTDNIYLASTAINSGSNMLKYGTTKAHGLNALDGAILGTMAARKINTYFSKFRYAADILSDLSIPADVYHAQVELARILSFKADK